MVPNTRWSNCTVVGFSVKFLNNKIFLKLKVPYQRRKLSYRVLTGTGYCSFSPLQNTNFFTALLFFTFSLSEFRVWLFKKGLLGCRYDLPLQYKQCFSTLSIFFFYDFKELKKLVKQGENFTKYDLSTGEKARMSSGIHLSANLGKELYTRPAKTFDWLINLRQRDT